jgi:hypothetical protein
MNLRTLTVTGVLTLAILASGCDASGLVRERVDESIESTQQRLADRSEEMLQRVGEARERDIDVVLSRAITLQQLQAAGIPVGSTSLGCDDPLHIVVVSGLFDRDDLLANSVSLAGGGTEALALRLVAHIYDPQTDMLLGTIGDPYGGGLNMIVSDPALPTGSAQAQLLFEPAGTGALTPFETCR